MTPAMFGPGSIAWLLRHELRLAVRSSKKPWRLLAFLVIALIVLHVVAIPAGRGLLFFEAKMASKVDLSPVVPLLGGFFWFTLGMTVMNSIGRTLNALFVRNDLDLLFSSPLSPHRVLAVRAFAIVAVAVLPLAILVVPFANVLAIVVNPRWLSLYLLILCVAVVATLFAMPICVALVRTIGVRRAQMLGQVIGILFGLTLALGSQIGFGPRGMLNGVGKNGFGLGDAPAFLRWGGELVLAPPLPILACLLVASFVLLMLSRWFGPVFATIAATSSARAARIGRATARGAIRFADTNLVGLFARKEWRLILRNPPLLLGVVSSPLVQMIPLALLSFRHQIGSGEKISGLWVFTVFIIAQIAGGLAWLAQSGEDAPDLLQLAPVEKSAITRAKAIGVLTPILGLLGAASLGLSFVELEYGVMIFVCGAAAASSCALLNVWYIQPGDRKKFAARRKGHWMIGIAEFAFALLWSWAAWKAIDHRFWVAGFAVVVALGLLALLRKKK
jgi:ABC-2 type transport system permease protein